MDLDTKCQQPFAVVMKHDSCIISKEHETQTRVLYNREYSAMNSLMACIPDHEFFKHVVKKLRPVDSTDILSQTGPIMLTKEFRIYIETLNGSEDPLKLIVLANASLFSPFVERYVDIKCIGKLVGKWKARGCRDLLVYRKVEDVKIKEAIVVHLFLHLGYIRSSFLIKTRDPLCRTFANMHFTYI